MIVRTLLHRAALCAALLATQRVQAQSAAPGLTKLNHIVVIYLENHSFDNLYSEFLGADGINAAVRAPRQIDASGTPYETLPQVNGSPIPTTLRNAPFNIAQFIPPAVPTRDLVHRFYQEQAQIDSGRMDRFVAVSDAQGLTMGYYHTAQLPLAAEAARYTLADHFFHSAFGGSFLNHFFLVSAAAPVFPSAPPSLVAKLDASGRMLQDGVVTPDGFVVNTAVTVNAPHPANVPPELLVPNQTMPNIGDRLSAKSISWAWYSGGWDDALAGHPDPAFSFHHQPFAYFATLADGTPAKAAHLKDEVDFFAAARTGQLPAVSFVKPIGYNNEHPGSADVLTGENHVKQLIDAVRDGPNWQDAAIIITYDENGGQWDHVAPPVIDRWGPGTRVPAIIISPFAKRGFVDHTPYETVSILALIEQRYGLAPLGTRDATAAPLTNAFDFVRHP